jgi:hypothetical protein
MMTTMNKFAVLLSLVLGTVVYAEESKTYNPADVTEAASHIELMPEYNKLTDGDANLVRLVYDLDWANGKYSVTGELPVGQLNLDSGTEETGIGDIRTRFFWKFYDSPNSRLENMVFNLDVFLPTGDSDKGLGQGTFVIVPSVIFAFPINENFTIYPIPKYKFSTGKTEGSASAFPPGKSPIPGRESEEFINAFEIEMSFVYEFKNHSAWMFLAPIYQVDFEPEPDEDNYELTLRGQVGKMFGRWGLGLEGTTFLAGEKSQEFQMRLLYFYYF